MEGNESPRLRTLSDGDLEPVIYVDLSEQWETNSAAMVRCMEGHPVLFFGHPDDLGPSLPRRVAPWAEILVQLVSHRLRSGHVHVAGFSFGGLVALECARMLRAQGRQLGLVGLVDSRRPERFPRRLRDEVALRWREALLWPSSAEKTRHLLRAIRRLPQRRWWGRAPKLLRAVRRFGLGRKVVLSRSAEGRSPRLLASVVGTMNYEPNAVDFPVVLVAAEDSISSWMKDPLLDWGPYLRGGCDLLRVGGWHLSLFDEDHFDANAPRIRYAFEQAMAVARPAPETSSSPRLIHVQTYNYEDGYAGAMRRAVPSDRIRVLPPLTAEGGKMPGSVEEWAEQQVGRMTAEDLDGPINLLGFSFGGLVVLEMARVLRDRGGDVRFVGILDVARPSGRARTVGDLVWDHLALATTTGRRLGWLTYWPAAARRKVRGAASIVARRVNGRADGGGGFVAAIEARYSAYRPPILDFPVELFTTGPTVAGRDGDTSLGWSRWMRGGFTVTQLEGDHYTMFEPDNAAVNSSRIVARLTVRNDSPL